MFNNKNKITKLNNQIIHKEFIDAHAFQNELYIYSILENSLLKTPKVLEVYDKCIDLSFEEGSLFLDLLDSYENGCEIKYDPWEKLVDWLISFYEKTGFTLKDPNLKNFIFREEVIGFDFEEIERGKLGTMLSRCVAYVLLYDPQFSTIKIDLSNHIEEYALKKNIELDVNKEIKEIQNRRNQKK